MLAPPFARPKTTGKGQADFVTNGAPSGSVTLPELWPGDIVLVAINYHPSDTLTQTAGPALTDIDAGTNFDGTGRARLHWFKAAPHNGDGKLSTDSGATLSYSNSGSTRSWAIKVRVLGAGHLTTPVNATALSNTTSGTTLAVTGATPTIDNGLLITCVWYVCLTNTVTNAFGAATSGVVDALDTEVNSNGSGIRNRGIGLYVSDIVPTINVAAGTRTVSFAGTPQTSAIAAYSLIFKPVAYTNADEVYTRPYAPGGSQFDLTADLIYPASGTAPFRTIVYLHGGAAGDKAIPTSPREAPRAIADRYGCAVVAINWTPTASIGTAPAYRKVMQDINCAIRSIYHLGANLNLRTDEPPRLFGTSFGAGWAAGVATAESNAYFLDDALGHAGYPTYCSRVLLWFGGYDIAVINGYRAALGIGGDSCGPNDLYGTTASPVDPCTLRRYNGAQYHGILSAPDQVDDITSGADLYNNASAIRGIQKGGWKACEFYCAHGKADATQPWGNTGADGGAPFSGLPLGIHAQLQAHGFASTLLLLDGAPHGANTAAWRDSQATGATNGAAIDAMLAWLTADLPIRRSRPGKGAALLQRIRQLTRAALPSGLLRRFGPAFGATQPPPPTPTPTPNPSFPVPVLRSRRDRDQRLDYLP